MEEQPLIRRWDDAETWLQTEARECAVRRNLPVSAAFVFHERRVSAIVETPVFCEEHAELITGELCRFLPQLGPHQLLLVWPAAYDLEGRDTIWALKAQLGERGRGWRTLLYRLPYDDADARIDGVETAVVDPWSARIRRVLAAPAPPIHETVLVTPHDERFAVFFDPDGAYGDPLPLFGYN